MSLSPTELYIGIAIALVISGSLAYVFYLQRKSMGMTGKKAKQPATDNSGASSQVKLQAYERLILLADRISLPSLIARVNQPGLALRDMQILLTQTIRQEFEHNITQQIYVTPEAWDAVRNLKEQNLLIINQVASYLPDEASGQDLNKSLLELVMNNPKASMHGIVAEALSFEAKKVLN